MTQNEKEKLSYCLGANIGMSLQSQGLEDLDVKNFTQALNDVLSKAELKINAEEINNYLQAYFGKIQQEQQNKAVEEGRKFLESNKGKTGITTLESGLQYEVLTEGNGAKPKASDTVTTHYHGTLISGEVFDSSVERGQPASFPVNGVIAGWVEALQLMAVGSKWRLFVPSNLAYGERGAGQKIGPHTTLIFEVELISID
ncbi:MAG: FKBP-type peptidyl-prolyl cis-trans isomerase [Crocinitomicaceae bacterium]|nr:FKBP-type peptidyl-prolyl cis-trans isomerase [Crocinitomicaceae bacterium]